ncbi:hypothetical protein U1Q18_027691 [Sarracenia purpurea var. burkii]
MSEAVMRDAPTKKIESNLRDWVAVKHASGDRTQRKQRGRDGTHGELREGKSSNRRRRAAVKCGGDCGLGGAVLGGEGESGGEVRRRLRARRCGAGRRSAAVATAGSNV